MIKRINLFLLGLMVMAQNAIAFDSTDVATFAVDTSAVEAIAVVVLGGLAVMWAIRKVIKLTNRS